MEILLPALLPFAFIGASLWLGFVHQRRRLRAWQDAAVACGLQNVESPGRSELSAQAGPVSVKIDAYGDKGTRIVVSVPGPPDFHRVSIRREPLVGSGRETEIGDPAFDSTFLIEGPARLVFALLDAKTRRLLLDVNTASRLEILNGTLQAEHLADSKIPHVLPLLIDIARQLAQPMDVPQRLTESAHRDPVAKVRFQILRLLIRELPGAAWTLEALRTACSDPSPEIRLLAARNLGTEGRGVLLDLAESLVGDIVSAEAVSALDRGLPVERARAILTGALRRRHIQTARACLKALGKSDDAAAVGPLVEVMEQERDDLAIAAALALKATGSPAAEPPLIRALRRRQLRAAAANALGRVGSVAAVLPLKEAAKRFWLDLDFQGPARQAIAEIQSRLPGASPGQLSLSGAEEGQLSLAQAEAGQLSLAAPTTGQAGQLSLPPES
ncbi:MAG TPA: hypothetical protein VEW48_05660 [Thermoanaerobaculia bacterium]|nr:hypothetical protein [Thermoanaerobaculia bacterium]